MRFHAVFDEPGIFPELLFVIRKDLVNADDQAVIGFLVLHIPDGAHARLALRRARFFFGEEGGTHHPVEGLIGAGIRVDQHGAIGFDHEEAGGRFEMRVQASGVIHRTGSKNNAHLEQHPISPGRGRIRPRHQRGMRLAAHGHINFCMSIPHPGGGDIITHFDQVDAQGTPVQAQRRAPG